MGVPMRQSHEPGSAGRPLSDALPDPAVDADHGVAEMPELAVGPGFECAALLDGARVIRLVLSGEFDLAGAPRFDELAADADRSGCQIVVDLRALTFMDSSGMRALLRLHARARGRITFLPGPPAVQRIFELAGVASVLPFG